MKKFWYGFWYIVITLFLIGCMLVSGWFVVCGLMNLFSPYGVNWPLWLLFIVALFVSSYALEVWLNLEVEL